MIDGDVSETLETQLNQLTDENHKLEETVGGLMSTIEEMTAQIKKMDSTAKSNKKKISKLQKKLGNLSMHGVGPQYHLNIFNVLQSLTKCFLLLDKISKQIKSEHGATQDDITSNVDADKKHPPKPPGDKG